MKVKRAPLGWGFCIQWVLVNTVSWGVAFPLLWFVEGAPDLDRFDAAGDAEVRLAVGAMAGAMVGILQWLVLRRQLSRTGLWILAMTVSFAFCLPLAVFLATGPIGVGALSGAVLCTITGILQWFVLRRRVSRFRFWILTSAAGLALSLPLIGLMVWARGPVVTGAMVGAVGG